MAYTSKYDYTLKFSPYLYNANGTLKSSVSFKDKYEFKVGYEISLNQAYWTEVVSQWTGADGQPLYEHIEDVPLPSNTEYLFRASFESVSNPATDGYTLEKNGYTIDQPSNGTFVITTDGTSSEGQDIYIYLVDPHREKYGTDYAFNTVTIKVTEYEGSYNAETKAREVTEKKVDKSIQVPKEPNELDEILLSATFEVEGALLPEYTPSIVTYNDVNITDGELVMTLAEGFTTDEVEVTTYPFSLNLVPDTVSTTVEEVTTVSSVYKSDLHGVKPGIYQVYATYKGERYRLRDLIIKGYNVLSPSKELQSETVTEDETPVTTYFYNANVGESLILSLYSNPVSDSKDTRLGLESSYTHGEVTLKMIPNCAGCAATAVVSINAFVDDPVEVTAINQLTPNGANVTELATRIIKVIPEVGSKIYVAPQELPESGDIKLFDSVLDIFIFADGRRVFTKNFGTDDVPYVLYQIATNEDDTSTTEYTFIYAMTVSEFVRIPAPEVDNGGGDGDLTPGD